jgi:hypothetical protein
MGEDRNYSPHNKQTTCKRPMPTGRLLDLRISEKSLGLNGYLCSILNNSPIACPLKHFASYPMLFIFLRFVIWHFCNAAFLNSQRRKGLQYSFALL